MTKARAKFAIIAAFVIAGFVGSVIYIGERSQADAMAAARRDLPQVRAYLDGQPGGKEVDVEVSDARGGCLWFSGSLANQRDCDVLESEINRRFSNGGYEIMYFVLSRDEDRLDKH